MDQSYLKIDRVFKSYSKGPKTTEVLADIRLTIDKGEFVSIIGHSGCGKSTLLNLIAGLTEVTTGAIKLEGREVNAPGPDRAVVFQNHSLLPWLSVYDNVKLAVTKVFAGRKTKAERHDWIMQNLDLVQMTHATDKRPGEISGGMRQRVGIARALAMEPKILLLDEPTSALDASVQAEVLNLLSALREERGLTFLMVSHDLAVIDHMCDRIMVLQHGRTVEEITRDDLASARMTTAYARSLFDASADRMLGATPEPSP